MTEERWPGEDRISATEEDDSGADSLEAEADGQPAPPEEQLEAEEAEKAADAEQRRDGDTPAPDDEPPAEEDELPRLRGPGHAPGQLSVPDGYGTLTGSSDGAGRPVAVVVSRFNGEVTNKLLESALDELELAGVARDAVMVVQVPGAFELPLGAMALAKTRRYSCIVALGCVIRGETARFEYISGEAASGLQLAALETGVPVAFGVLTVDTPEQANARVASGAAAVRTALEMADLFHQLRSTAQAAR